MLLPIKLLTRRNILGPITPVEDENGHSWLVVGGGAEEISLEESRFILHHASIGVGSLGSPWAGRRKIVALDTHGRPCIAGWDVVALFRNDVSHTLMDDISDCRVSVFGSNKVDQCFDWLDSQLVNLIMLRPNQSGW